RCLTCAKNKRCEFQSTSEEPEMHKYPMRYYQERHTWYGPDHRERAVGRSNPFIELDFNECILCARCVRACDEVRGLSCYELTYKGPDSRIDTSFGLPLQAVGCDGCGACVDVCPVACILDKPSKWQGPAQRTVTTTCPFCGDGCQLEVEVQQERILRVGGVKAVEGVPMVTCSRGRNGLGYVHDARRLTQPLIRRDGRLQPATWDEAAALVATRFAGYRRGGLGAAISPQLTNEESYAAQKFVRTVMGSENIAVTGIEGDRALVAPIEAALGVGAGTGSLEDLAAAKRILVMGSDIASTNAVAAWQIRRAARVNGAHLIVASPRANEMTKWAETWLQYRPGTETVLLTGLLNVMVTESLINVEFIEANCEGYEALQAAVAGFDPERTAATTGVAVEHIRRAAQTLAAAGGAAFVYDAGVTQHTDATGTVPALVNLALATGSLGTAGAGLFPLRDCSNQQGAEDLGYRGHGGVPAGRALLLAGSDPLATERDRAAWAAAARAAEFVVVFDSFLTATAAEADVVLPLATFAEQDGTRTNSERRIQRSRAIIAPVGESRPLWAGIAAIAARMDSTDCDFSAASSVFQEIAGAVPSYRGVSYERLEQRAIQWPCPDKDHPGTGTLFTEGFGSRRARFLPISAPDGHGAEDAAFPLLLAAGLSRIPYHREVLAAREDAATRAWDEELLTLRPDDALRFDIADGESVTVETPTHRFAARVALDDSGPSGVLFLRIPVLADPSVLLSGPLAELVEAAAGLRLSPAVVRPAR
ncbi:MAG: molybdopterin-dependent oxidoreductase, partial [Chloroflexota bacterium]